MAARKSKLRGRLERVGELRASSSPASPTPAAASPPAAATTPKEPTDYDRWQAALTPTERRVEQITDLMLAGRWLSGQSDKLLAKEWGVVPSYVRTLSAEAYRGLRRFMRDQDVDFRDERRAELVALFGAVARRAQLMNSPNALRVVLQAAELQGRYLGVEPPRSLNVNTDPRGFGKMSDAQLAAFANGEEPPEDKPAPDDEAP